MARASERTYMNSAVCHHCGEPMKYDYGVRSNYWAYGMAGVRWVLCSAACVRGFDAGRVEAGVSEPAE